MATQGEGRISQGGVWQQRDICTYIYTLCINIPLGRISQGGVWQQRDIYTYICTLCKYPFGAYLTGRGVSATQSIQRLRAWVVEVAMGMADKAQVRDTPARGLSS